MTEQMVYMWSAIIGLGGGLVVALLYPYFHRRFMIEQRLDQFFGQRQLEETWGKKNKAMRMKVHLNRLENSIDSIFRSSSAGFSALKALLYRSGVQKNITLFLLLYLIILCTVFFMSFMMVGFSFIKSVLIAGVFSTSALLLFIRMRANRWEKEFLTQFPVALDMIVRSLKAGLTLGRGIAVVAEEVPYPVGFEFRKLAAQLQIGSTPDKAIMDAANRVNLDDFRFFSLALLIQREMGGSLSEVLRKLSDVIRDRAKFRKRVKALSAEAKVTGFIVGGLPFLAAAGIEMINPGYLKFFVDDPSGQTQGMVILVMTLMSIITMRQLISVET